MSLRNATSYDENVTRSLLSVLQSGMETVGDFPAAGVHECDSYLVTLQLQTSCFIGVYVTEQHRIVRNCEFEDKLSTVLSSLATDLDFDYTILTSCSSCKVTRTPR